MCVVAHTALLKPGRVVGVDLRKVITYMAIETATYCDKTPPPIQPMALGTLYAGNRRMLMKRLKSRRRIRANKKMHFLLAALPQQN